MSQSTQNAEHGAIFAYRGLYTFKIVHNQKLHFKSK